MSVGTIAALTKSTALLNTHLQAGHADPSHPKYPKFLKDLRTHLILTRRFLADDVAIAALQAEIDAGTITPEAAQAVVDSLAATNAKLADLDSDPLTPV